MTGAVVESVGEAHGHCLPPTHTISEVQDSGIRMQYRRRAFVWAREVDGSLRVFVEMDPHERISLVQADKLIGLLGQIRHAIAADV